MTRNKKIVSVMSITTVIVITAIASKLGSVPAAAVGATMAVVAYMIISTVE